MRSFLLHLVTITILWAYFSMHAIAQNTTIATTTTVPDTTQMYTTVDPTTMPTTEPTNIPTSHPTLIPTFMPTVIPTYQPTITPTVVPSGMPTNKPSAAPTQEPTIEPTYMPSGDPTMNPTVKPISDPVTVKVEIKITVTNATEEGIKEILEETLSKILPSVMVKDIKSETDEIENIITFTLEIEAADENEADDIIKTIEGTEFKDTLSDDIEDKIDGSDVSNISTSAAIISDDEDDGKTKAKWLDPTTYGLLNWIIFGAACCILCIFCLFICRCCFLCCSKTRRMKRSQSGYQVGQAMFNQIDSNADNDSAFQSDLKSAIEMNTKGKLLTKVESLGSLDPDAVNNAFDMDFDEKKPINDALKEEHEVKEVETEDDENEQKKKKKMSEGIVKPETTGTNGTTLGTTPGGPTPGGPTPGGPDDEDNPPPAPKPPENVQDIDEYDLL